MVSFNRSESSDSEQPLLTIGMPIFNAGAYLRLAVLSILQQSFKNWELLIIDDGSDDDALQTIEDLKDSRIRILIDGSNRGLAARLNECVELACGKYFARMDQDDVSYPDRFLLQFLHLEQNPNLDLLAVRAITIDEKNNITGLFPAALTHAEICAKPWRGFYLPHPTWMGKIEWFRRNRYAVPGPYFCEDQELLLRSYKTSVFATLDSILFAYRVRNKVNWRKLSLTRRTVLTLQLKYLSEESLIFTFLALITYAGRIFSDLGKRLGFSHYKGGRDVDHANNEEWTAVLNRLSLNTTE
ncbi:glycosyltransferase family 2 protein [Herminiimonas sp. NPDC097707]|uniref:glycosyltransferase family 2 protein n=1 Tax=Herminiimonas sp. NPDC097707 TaxID=3364007 RepID=UPI00383A0090